MIRTIPHLSNADIPSIKQALLLATKALAQVQKSADPEAVTVSTVALVRIAEVLGVKDE